MFEGKKYDIATIILLLFLLWKIPGQIISFFVVYPLSYLVLTLLFLALNIIAFIGIVLRKTFGSIILIVASIIGIITALFLFSYNNPLNQMADIVSALIMILLGFYDYKKIKSSIEKPWIFVLIFIILVIVLVFLSGATS